MVFNEPKWICSHLRKYGKGMGGYGSKLWTQLLKMTRLLQVGTPALPHTPKKKEVFICRHGPTFSMEVPGRFFVKLLNRPMKFPKLVTTTSPILSLRASREISPRSCARTFFKVCQDRKNRLGTHFRHRYKTHVAHRNMDDSLWTDSLWASAMFRPCLKWWRKGGERIGIGWIPEIKSACHGRNIVCWLWWWLWSCISCCDSLYSLWECLMKSTSVLWIEPLFAALLQRLLHGSNHGAEMASNTSRNLRIHPLYPPTIKQFAAWKIRRTELHSWENRKIMQLNGGFSKPRSWSVYLTFTQWYCHNLVDFFPYFQVTQIEPWNAAASL